MKCADLKHSPPLAETLMIQDRKPCKKNLCMKEFVPHNHILLFP